MQRFPSIEKLVVIVTHIWQKLSSVEREETLIVTNFWQLFSQVFGETLLIVTHIWRNHTCSFLFVRPWHPFFEQVVNFLAL